MTAESSILRLISGDKPLVLDARDGKATIAQAGEVFTDHINPNFKKWNLDQAGEATTETPVAVYDMADDATFEKIFRLLGRDSSELFLEQDQIINFVAKHTNWLRDDGYAIFFLFRVGDRFFVAVVGSQFGSLLGVNVYRFENNILWRAIHKHHVVLPL